MKLIFFVLTIICGLVSLALIGYALTMNSATQEVATSVSALALTVVPYCLGRAFQGLQQDTNDVANLIFKCKTNLGEINAKTPEPAPKPAVILEQMR